MNWLEKIITMLALVWLMASSFNAQAEVPDDFALGDSWQMTRLFDPGPAALALEEEGGIVIYEGIRDVDVERAMDEQFDRIEHMMFVGTVVTNEDGEPVVDPQTGQTKTEDDDC